MPIPKSGGQDYRGKMGERKKNTGSRNRPNPSARGKPARSGAPHEAGPSLSPAVPPGGTDAKGSFHVVGIGASAGGLEAFEQFFSNMPVDTGMTFVLIPHLSPEHKSMMGELLKRHTSMDIFQ